MKRILTYIMLLLCPLTFIAQPSTDSIFCPLVKTVTLILNEEELEKPIIELGSSNRLFVRFDILDPEPVALRYSIQHCNRNWELDDLEPYEYMLGFEQGYIDNYQPSLNTLTNYINYYQLIPEENATFIASGNYVLTVFLQDNPDSILFTKRFWVTEASAKIRIEQTRPFDASAIMQKQEVDVMISENKDYSGTLFSPTLNPEYFSILIQQNGRTDNQRFLRFSGYERQSLCFRQRQENIFWGGNKFRWFDISNMRTAMYNVQRIEEYGGERFALLKPLEDRSSKVFVTETVLNGQSKINVWDRTDVHTEADYVWVHFTLPLTRPYLNGNIYIVGEMTQWGLNELNRMDWDPTIKAYRTKLFLKQGYYSYQLLFVPTYEKEGLTSTLEGDHFETPNIYTIFAYYHSPADRYDRLVAIKSNQ